MINNSILLCTYNEGKYIKDTILNLDKSLSNLEIVIVDDNSKDNTLSIIKNLETNCKIKLKKREKIKGLGSAFQRALMSQLVKISGG